MEGKLRDFVTIGYFNPQQIPVEPLPCLSVKHGMDRDPEGIWRDSAEYHGFQIPSYPL